MARIAVAQVRSERESASNLARVSEMTRAAADGTAAMVVFPEYLMSWGEGRHGRDEMRAVAEPMTGGFAGELRDMCRSHAIWMVAGLLEMDARTDDKPFNTLALINANGQFSLAYRKTHLFDALGKRESSVFGAGKSLAEIVETPVGRVGILVCYELRFPEVARSLALGGAEVLIVPSAWYAGPLKEMQWESLLRTRAIENGCYVVAAAQSGHEFAGNSMVVDPQGVVIAAAGQGEKVIFAELNREMVTSAREAMPSLSQRRSDLYRP